MDVEGTWWFAVEKGEPPLGGEGKVVEPDETFIGGKENNRHKSKRASRRLTYRQADSFGA